MRKEKEPRFVIEIPGLQRLGMNWEFKCKISEKKFKVQKVMDEKVSPKKIHFLHLIHRYVIIIINLVFSRAH